eukprot:g2143.t1
MFHHGYKAVTFEDMKTKLDGSSVLSREAFFPLRFSASKGLKRSPSTCEENPEYPRSSLVRDQDAFLRFVWEDQDNGCLGIKQHLIKQLPKCWPKKNALQPRLCWGLDTESDCETKKDDFEKFTCQWNPVAHLELLLVESDEADLNNMSDDFVQELSYGLFSKSVRKECQKYFNLIKPLSYLHRGEYMGNAEILAASRYINDEATLEKPAMTIEQGVLQQTAEPASPPSRIPVTNGCERFPTKEDRKGQYANMKEAYPLIHVDTQLPPMDDWIRYLEQHRPKMIDTMNMWLNIGKSPIGQSFLMMRGLQDAEHNEGPLSPNYRHVCPNPDGSVTFSPRDRDVQSDASHSDADADGGKGSSPEMVELNARLTAFGCAPKGLLPCGSGSTFNSEPRPFPYTEDTKVYCCKAKPTGFEAVPPAPLKFHFVGLKPLQAMLFYTRYTHHTATTGIWDPDVANDVDVGNEWNCRETLEIRFKVFGEKCQGYYGDTKPVAFDKKPKEWIRQETEEDGVWWVQKELFKKKEEPRTLVPPAEDEVPPGQDELRPAENEAKASKCGATSCWAWIKQRLPSFPKTLGHGDRDLLADAPRSWMESAWPLRCGGPMPRVQSEAS